MLVLLFEDVTNQHNNSKEVGKFATPELALEGAKEHAEKNKYKSEMACADIEDGHLDAAFVIGGHLRLYRTEAA